MLSEVLDKEIGGTIEGQSLAAPIMLLDKLKEDGKRLEQRCTRYIAACTAEPPTRPHLRMRAHAKEGEGMAQIQVTGEYKKAVEAYEAAFGERPPYCVKDPEYIMECVRRGEPSDHVPDPNACY